jgi:hydrogenase maturation protease
MNRPPHTLILGIGNVLMGDEGVGVHVVRYLENRGVPDGAALLDGGTGSLTLLEPMQSAGRIVLIDATVDGSPPGTVRPCSTPFTFWGMSRRSSFMPSRSPLRGR